MALNPVAYSERRSRRAFLRYHLTAYPFSDPHIPEQMRELLSLDCTRASPLNLRDESAAPCVSALSVYPMNALAEDRFMRIRGLLAGTGNPFGIFVGKTPARESDVAGASLRPRAVTGGHFYCSLNPDVSITV